MEKPQTVQLHPRTFGYLEHLMGGPLPQTHLAERWQVSRTTVSRWLRGVVRMPAAAAQDLATLAGVPLDHLLDPPAIVQEEAPAPRVESLTPIMQEFVRAEVERAMRGLGTED